MATRRKSLEDCLNKFYGLSGNDIITFSNSSLQQVTACWRIDKNIRKREVKGHRGFFTFREVHKVSDMDTEYMAEVLIDEPNKEWMFNPHYDRARANQFFTEKLGGKVPAGAILPFWSEKTWGYDPKFRPKKIGILRW